MKNLSIQLPETVFSSLRKSPDEFVQEMRIAAAVKWYELGEISQNKAADIAGITKKLGIKPRPSLRQVLQ